VSEYMIVMRSGYRLKIAVKDGEKFVRDVTRGLNENPSAAVQWYVEGDVLLNVSEIACVVPCRLVVGKKGGSGA